MSAYQHAALHGALQRSAGPVEIYRLARDDPLGLSFRFGPRGDTPLHVAARKGDASSIEMLCAAKANPNATNFLLNTPLHVAAQNHKVDCIEVLILCGADIEARNKDGFTPFLSATWFGAIECMRVLHAHGAKVKRVKT